MGDLRNKLAKIERAAREKKAFEQFMRSGAPLLERDAARQRKLTDEDLDLELLSYPLPAKKRPRAQSRLG